MNTPWAKSARTGVGAALWVGWFALAGCESADVVCAGGEVAVCPPEGTGCACSKDCALNTDCPLDEYCWHTPQSRNYCLPARLYVSLCASGLKCPGGSCVTSAGLTRCAPVCTRDQDCADGCCAPLPVRYSTGDVDTVYLCVASTTCGGRVGSARDGGADGSADASARDVFR